MDWYGAMRAIETRGRRWSKGMGMGLVTLARVAAVLLAVASAATGAGLGEGEVYAPETDAPAVDAPGTDAAEVDRPGVDVPPPGLDMGTRGSEPPEGSAANNPAVGQPEAEAVPPDEAVRDLLPPEDDGVVHELREADTPELD
jgi:hypothetical protein